MLHDQPTTPPLSSDDRIDEICDAFEAEWLDGRRPEISAYLQDAASGDRAALFSELLLLDVEYRKVRGEPLSGVEYLAHFPEFAEQIETIDFKRGFDCLTAVGDAESKLTSPKSMTPKTRIAHFELLERLGAGSAGEVWKARDTRLHRIVALKLPHSRNLSNAELNRFLREGRAAARLRHPYIVPVYEIGRDRDTVFIVSEYVAGGDLRQRLKHDRLSFQTAAEICAKLADALHHAHEQGIVHRDLKPANVIVDCDDQPHITDFGLAKWTNEATSLTLEGQLLGTIAYMAPEQASGQVSQVDRRTDVYALGAMLYEMLTGICPFRGDEAATIHAILQQEATPPRKLNKHIPRDLETICLKAIEKTPRDRYPSAQELGVDLQRVLRGEPILASRSGPLAKILKWVRRRPATAAAIALAILAISSLAVAGRFAATNHVLLGLQTVNIATDPPGAELTLYPLDESTGKPIPNRIIHGSSKTPTSEQLQAGDYFVVAVLNDGRFHEVYRRVPKPYDGLPGNFRHQRWRRLPDGALEWPKIVMPQGNIAATMVKVDGDEFSLTSSRPDELSNRAPDRVRSFYIASEEFTIGDYKRLCDNRLPIDRRAVNGEDDSPATVSYEEAMSLAEADGKRLPTELEYEFAAMQVGQTDIPSGDQSPNDDQATSTDSDSISRHEFEKQDRTSSPVVGLCSGVAEWTSSFAQSYLDPDTGIRTNVLESRLASSLRIVKGGDTTVIEGNLTLAAEHRDPHGRVALPPYWIKPGLGFRCYRSVTPHTSIDDFSSSSALEH